MAIVALFTGARSEPVGQKKGKELMTFSTHPQGAKSKKITPYIVCFLEFKRTGFGIDNASDTK
jgi:hypothetical protein